MQAVCNVTSLLLALGKGTCSQLEPNLHNDVLAPICSLYLGHALPVLDRSTTEDWGL